jgi:endonuclease/exonuclease/phosphatase family metal-dependent hydrolase
MLMPSPPQPGCPPTRRFSRSERQALIVVPALFVLACGATVHRASFDPRSLVCRHVAPDAGQAVSWIAPDADGDRIRLTAWCAAVGPVLYEPRPVSGPGADARPLDRLAVVSWNTHVGGGDVDAVVDGIRAGNFTNGQTFDHVVLLLQEVYRSGGGVPEKPARHTAIPGRISTGSHETHERDVRNVAHRRGMAVLYAPAMRNGLIPGDPEDRGNAILSTIPLSDPAVVELPFERQRRVAAVASIGGRTSTGTPWRLRLVNVHLDTALAITRGGPFRARARQIEGLLAALSDPLPAMVAGDFNAWLGEREPAIKALRGAYPEVPPVPQPTWTGPLGVRAPLDHVFARGELAISVQRLPGRFGSDHFPLLAVVNF